VKKLFIQLLGIGNELKSCFRHLPAVAQTKAANRAFSPTALLAARLARSGIKEKGRRRLTAQRRFDHAPIVHKPEITMSVRNENGAFYDGTADCNSLA